MKRSIAPYRFLFAGGGTGGHLFPAIAVAEKIRKMLPESDIMFIGTKSRIEGRIVPKLGFKFSPIWIKGFSRKLNLENLLFPLKLAVSLIQSLLINLRFKPMVAIGSGGYVSGPAIWGASVIGAKIILLEQNSYPGITTRLLQKYASEIHLSFDDSKKYFKQKNKLNITGNPVRESLVRGNKEEALNYFGLNPSYKTLFVLGGSLGAGSVNEAIGKFIRNNLQGDINIIWQTGKNYFELYKYLASKNIIIRDFIDNMDQAYSACDLLVSRAGATTIAEIIALGVPAILIPSPNVAENHQFFNAKSLSDKNAAVLIEDSKLSASFNEELLKVLRNNKFLDELSLNAKSLYKFNAAEIIANNAINYCKYGKS
ncbi:MAG: undecaprenyldiphospho-muramoylpentapeptide beta-N-acetylglucosaminyltransferase [Ignavibacteriaceae bacterium]|nr:undecaprenyldiphospho-muramoylpentapeptide beta-N-acetylglucosaminyltransferase [Ignavibacteriaceae bacterium]